MAIYHLNVKIVQRSKGKNVIAAAAYRRAARLYDHKEQKFWDYTHKKEVIYHELMIPEHAPQWAKDLLTLHQEDPTQAIEILWNQVDAAEKRVNSQLARDVRFALPLELTPEQNILLIREFIQDQFVLRGMIADWNIHWDKENPHVHLLLTMSYLTEQGFGQRAFEWNRKSLLYTWRRTWSEYANFHLKYHQHDIKIDHRSYAAQGIHLVPTLHQGKAIQDMEKRGILTDIMYKSHRIFKENQKRIRENFEILLHKLSASFETFTQEHLEKEFKRYFSEKKSFQEKQNTSSQKSQEHQDPFEQEKVSQSSLTSGQIEDIFKVIEYHESVFTEKKMEKTLISFAKHEEDLKSSEEFSHVMEQLLSSKQLLFLGVGEDGHDRFTTRRMFECENQIQNSVEKLQVRPHLPFSTGYIQKKLERYEEKAGVQFTEEQGVALKHLLKPFSICCLVGRAGTGKSFLLGAAREIWESQGVRLWGVALSGVAAQNLSQSAGIPARTIDSFRYALYQRQISLRLHDVVVMDEAGMTDSVSMRAIVQAVQEAQAKLILVGDHAQLQPVGPGASFRAIVERIGFAEIHTVYRQSESWQREATTCFSSGQISKGLEAYEAQHQIHFEPTDLQALSRLVNDWFETRNHVSKDLSQMIVIAHRNKDVNELNRLLREKRIEQHEIQPGFTIKNKPGHLKWSQGDRILFLKNDRRLGVSNGCFGTIQSLEINTASEIINFTVILDKTQKAVCIHPHTYQDFTYGYAATVHKVQGITIDHTFVYAGGTFWNRHLTYVAMSRHRQTCHLYAATSTHQNFKILKKNLRRQGRKESVLDFPTAFAERRGIDTRTFWTFFRDTFKRKRSTSTSEESSHEKTSFKWKNEATYRERMKNYLLAFHTAAKRINDLQASSSKEQTLLALQEALKAIERAEYLYNHLTKIPGLDELLQRCNLSKEEWTQHLDALKNLRKQLKVFETLKNVHKQNFTHRTSPHDHRNSKNRAPSFQDNDIQRVRDDLKMRAAEVAQHYLGDPQLRSGNVWRYGSHQGSLVVTVQGQKQGLWHDFQTSEGGDLLSLIGYARGLMEFKAILHEAQRFLGGEAMGRTFSSIKEPLHFHKTSSKESDALQKIQRAQAIVQATQPIAGTCAERYLREHRGIQGQLYAHTFRYHPALKNWMTGDSYPALVVVARDKNEQVCGIQAIFLDPHTGKKASLGHHTKLSRGLVGEGAQVQPGSSSSSVVAFAEGTETALSVAQAHPEWNVYVTFGVSNFAKVALKVESQRVLLCADNDGKDSATQKGIERAAKMLSEHGKEVWVAEPQKPIHQKKWDFNDTLRTQGLQRVQQDLAKATLVQARLTPERTFQAMSTTLASLESFTEKLKTALSTHEIPIDDQEALSLDACLTRYVDLEVEHTHLVQTMHASSSKDASTRQAHYKEVLSSSRAIHSFVIKHIHRSDINTEIEKLKGLKTRTLAQCGGLENIQKRLQQGNGKLEDRNVILLHLKNKALYYSRTQMHERGRGERV